MMRRLMTVVAAAALALTPLAAARAAGQAAAAPTGTAKMRHMTAEVKAVDTAAKTLTVKRGVRGDLTFKVAPEAAGSLADLKPGERVRITYERTGGEVTAHAIAPVAHTAKK
jgi:Cu/Ag efflux protein CusF